MTTVSTSLSPAAALWDMDGTIIDTEPAWLRTEMAMLDRYNLSLPPEFVERLVGQGLTAAAGLFREVGVPLSVDEIINEWADNMVTEVRSSAPRWMPGAVELLEGFRERGVPNALVTMSVRRIADAVVDLLPGGIFSVVIAGDEVEYEKPHPDPYLRAAAALGVQAEQCIAFEDSHPGTAAAAAAGTFVVGVPNIVSLDGSAAHTVLPTLEGVDAGEASSIWQSHIAHNEENI